MKNARFWVWSDGWVKLTVKPNQVLEHCSGGPTDEGWHRESTTWEHDGVRVYRSYSSESRDCDGRHGYQSDDSCRIDDLNAKNAHHWDDEAAPTLCTSSGVEIIRVPNWEDSESSQYDQYAEMAGY